MNLVGFGRHLWSVPDVEDTDLLVLGLALDERRRHRAPRLRYEVLLVVRQHHSLRLKPEQILGIYVV